MGTHWELEGNKGKFGGWGYLFILVGLLFKFVVAWFVPNGKGFEQNNLKLCGLALAGVYCFRANYGFVR